MREDVRLRQDLDDALVLGRIGDGASRTAPRLADAVEGGAEEHEVGIRLEGRDLRGEAPGIGDVVGVEPGDQRRAGIAPAPLQRRDDARRRLAGNDDPGILPAKAGEDRRRAVARSVIDHDHLARRLPLAHDAADGSLDETLAVPHRQDDAHDRNCQKHAPRATMR